MLKQYIPIGKGILKVQSTDRNSFHITYIEMGGMVGVGVRGKAFWCQNAWIYQQDESIENIIFGNFVNMF